MAVSGGGYHTLAVKADGTLWAWGRGAEGQLGNGLNSDQHLPVRVGTETNWASVFAGKYHSLGLKADGTLWAWGLNSDGQLGIGGTVNQNSPVQVEPGSLWQAVSAGAVHTLGLKPDGTLWGWGNGDNHQFWNQDSLNPDVPVQIGWSGDPDMGGEYEHFRALAAGAYQTVAVETSGSLRAVVGDGTSAQDFEWTGDWQAIAAGSYHGLGVTSDGTLWAWGSNDQGQLGIDGPTDWTPNLVGKDNNWAAVSAGEYHGMALKADNSVWVWGNNAEGQLGSGDTTTRTTPAVSDFGPPTVYYRDADGDTYGDPAVSMSAYAQPPGWVGNNLDPDDTDPANTPETLIPWAERQALDALYQSTGGADWTNNTNWGGAHGSECTWYGVTCTPAYSAYSGRTITTLDLHDNHLVGSIPAELGNLTSLRYLFLNDNELSGPIPTTLTNLTRLVDHQSDIRGNALYTTDDTLAAFLHTKQIGGDWESTQDLSAMNATIKTFSVGDYHILGVKTDGTLWAWGYNNLGQLGTGDTADRIFPVRVGTDADWSAVAAGEYHSLALKNNGTLWAWGNNRHGAAGNRGWDGLPIPCSGRRG